MNKPHLGRFLLVLSMVLGAFVLMDGELRKASALLALLLAAVILSRP